MKIFGTILGTAFAMALLAGLLVGGYNLALYVASVFTLLEPQTRAVTAIVSVVVLLAAVIVAQATKGRGAERAGVARAAIYRRVLSICCEPVSAAECDMVKVERSLALLGNTRVISCYAKLRQLRTHMAEDEARAALLKTLVLEMRRDLGRSDLTGAPTNVLRLLMGSGSCSESPANSPAPHTKAVT